MIYRLNTYYIKVLFVLLAFVLLPQFAVESYAQELTVKRFMLDENDNTANDDATMRFDQNGDVCALLKLKTTEKDFSYDVGSLGITGDPEEKDGEIWLFVPFGIKRITLRHQRFGTCEYAIPIAVESGKVYIVELSTSGASEVEEDQEVQIVCEPQTATLFVDSTQVKLVKGVYKARLELGEHTITVSCGGYITQTGSFTLNAVNPVMRRVVLNKEGETAEDVFSEQPREFIIPGTKIKFKLIPVKGATYMRGAMATQSEAQDDEKPAHECTVGNYYIGETEVTQELWEAIMEDNPSRFRGPDLPVEQVSWNACRLFITKLGKVLGQKFRLPTEAEWEYAARGGKNALGKKYSGGEIVDEVGWYLKNSEATTHAVATKKPNELGIFDMSGNVREWCSDLYGNYSAEAKTNPQGAASSAHRVCRGGSWTSNDWNCRTTYRDINPPENTDSQTGLRLAM